MTRRLEDRGIRVPDGFATTAEAYRAFLAHNQLEKPLRERLDDLDPEGKSPTKVGQSVRQLLVDAELPLELTEQLGAAYRDLSARYGSEAVDVAVRSSATAEVEVAEAERRAPVLSDEEVLQMARWGCLIEEHYGRPMDVEWAKDGDSGDLYIVQARPETVQSRREATTLTSYGWWAGAGGW